MNFQKRMEKSVQMCYNKKIRFEKNKMHEVIKGGRQEKRRHKNPGRFVFVETRSGDNGGEAEVRAENGDTDHKIGA